MPGENNSENNASNGGGDNGNNAGDAGQQGNNNTPQNTASTDQGNEASAQEQRIAELEKQLQDKGDKLKQYEEKDAAELEKQKTAEQKVIERDVRIAELERNSLVEKIRREGGYSAAVFDVVNPTGKTEEEIKQAFETHKAALDEYAKSKTKDAPGGGTGGGVQPKNSATKNRGDNTPYLVRMGLVKPKQAV